jgi:hypothetical protein
MVGVGANALMVADRPLQNLPWAIKDTVSNRSAKFGTETHVNVTSYNWGFTAEAKIL